MITIFTDGSSRGNPGPGGWGTIIISNNQSPTTSSSTDLVVELGGSETRTTNNKMELMAAAEGLRKASELFRKVPQPFEVTVYTDSSYLINGITKWISGWKRNGWMTKIKEDVSNKDVWMMIDEAMKGIKVSWKYVGGHAGVEGNERCDVIATTFADGEPTTLYNGPLSGYILPNILNVSHSPLKLAEKKSSSSHSKAKAYSYVSAVGGVVQIHHTWADCEKRVKGTKGARFKKAISRDDEARLRAEFS